MAYLCLGYVSHFYQRPELEVAGWRQRLPLEELLHFDRWGEDGGAQTEALKQQIRNDQMAASAGGIFPSVE